MRILWISPNGGNYKQNPLRGTGGWIGALQHELTKRDNVELGIAFLHDSDDEDLSCDNTTYFPICTHTKNNKLLKFIHSCIKNKDAELKKNTERLLQAVHSFRPDIVHLWGIENDYAEIIPYMQDKYKMVVHIQGLTSLYISSYLPPFVSLSTIGEIDSIKNLIARQTQKNDFLSFLNRAKREIKYAPLVKYWIGRTDWDKKASEMLSPGSKYFHCDELMRRDFIGYQWQYHYDGTTIHIHSSISPCWYKGIDVVFKTAHVLKMKGVKVTWKLFGIEENNPIARFFMKLYKLSNEDLGISFCGFANAETIRNSLLECDMYIHPSYIENSSNAIAEAMMLGVPTIAQYVGGNPSMLKDNSGVLVAPNEPYMMAYEIIKMRNKEWAEGYSERALKFSLARQNGDKVVNSLIDIYTEIISD